MLAVSNALKHDNQQLQAFGQHLQRENSKLRESLSGMGMGLAEKDREIAGLRRALE
jgi:hypothetical protein